MLAGAPLKPSSPVYQLMYGGAFPAGLDVQKRTITLDEFATKAELGSNVPGSVGSATGPRSIVGCWSAVNESTRIGAGGASIAERIA